MRNYIKAAIDLFRSRRVQHTGENITDYISLILTAARKYEEVPKRRFMITDDMMVYLIKMAKQEDDTSELASIVDWIILGRYTGFRRSEFCQTRQTKFDKVEEYPGKPPRALILSDIRFLDERQRLLKDSFSTQRACYIRVKFWFQKNLDNGEEVDFARDNVLKSLCPVRAALRIRKRALKLGAPVNEPAAVFQTRAGKRCFITDTLVAKTIRLSAKEVLNITDKKELHRWSTHSIRVTAANLLHRANMTDSFIQKRLRWKSTTFLMYLRNTIYAANAHSKALNISESNLPHPSQRVYREPEAHELLAAPAA